MNLNQQTSFLPDDFAAQVENVLIDWRDSGKVRRLWDRDPSLWTGADEAKWLGWLDIVKQQLADSRHLPALAADIRSAGFSHALLLGMGGSSLCPEVLQRSFGGADGYPAMHVLDSTDPAQVKTFENKVDLANTIFIVASKSGSTLEPTIFKQYFFDRVSKTIGADKAGERFIAITDPGSKLEEEASGDGFRHIFHGVANIGGRFSALSNFGMAPAAVMGIDAVRFLEHSLLMAEACQSAQENPGVELGALLGVMANNGRDKLTLICSPAIHDLGAWLEQLIAESTGKEGKAIIPVDREPLVSPEIYGSDRLFAYIRLETSPDAAQDAAVDALEKAGHPVVRISMGDVYDLGQEFFRWEFATAVACAVMGVNPFSQPDVQFSKTETKKLTDSYEKSGSFPEETPILEDGGVKLYASPENAQALASGGDSLAGCLRAHLDRIGKGDYFALLAYIEMNTANEETLQQIRGAVLDSKLAATCLGFGPRFLHSTGQAYKAGPSSGVFLQITCDDAADLEVPGQKYTFGVVKAAQARGDFQVLADRGRRALRVHLGADIEAGLVKLKDAL